MGSVDFFLTIEDLPGGNFTFDTQRTFGELAHGRWLAFNCLIEHILCRPWRLPACSSLLRVSDLRKMSVSVVAAAPQLTLNATVSCVLSVLSVFNLYRSFDHYSYFIR